MPEVVQTQRRRRRRWSRLVLATLLLSGAGLWFTRATWYGVEVEVASPRRGPIVETLVTAGRVHVPARHAIASTVSARVTGVEVQLGEAVRAGQPLVRLDDADARHAVERARAVLAGIMAARADLGDRRRPAAREALAQARLSLAQAERDLARDAKLEADGALTAADRERSALSLELARSRLRAASAEARVTTADGATGLTIDAQEAEARAALAAAETRLALFVVTAPADGIVAVRAVEPGDVAQPGVPLLRLISGRLDTIVVEPDEKQLGRLAIGQAAVVSADAFPERPLPAKVSWIAPSVDPRRGTVEVHLELSRSPETPEETPDPSSFLRADMTVSVEIALERREDAITLPRSLVFDLATSRPWVLVVENERALRRDLSIGATDEERVEITGGLAEDAAVIIPSKTTLSEGARVRVRVPGGTEG